MLFVVGAFVVSHVFAAAVISWADLDGDEYFVCWDTRLVPDQEYPAADFSPKAACVESFRVKPSGPLRGLSRDDRLYHFLGAVSRPNPSVTLGEIDSCFQHWADEKDPASDECRTLAAIFSCAVDGGKVSLERWRAFNKPDISTLTGLLTSSRPRYSYQRI
jgi:hypothetical protein